MSELIAAIATAPYKSAIGIIRLSGDGAIAAVSGLFKPKKGGKLSEMPGHRTVYGELVTPEDSVLDTCVAVTAREPHSYTGEETAELQCHGSPAVLAAVMRYLLRSGARQARPGEFTKRAFLNGKLDLIQAEAVADLIDAETEMAALNAAAQLGGAVSGGLNGIYDRFTVLCAHFHAVIDYPDEDLEPFTDGEVIETLESAFEVLRRLKDGFSRGTVIKDGVKCAIIGKPNAGKSSLLNALLGYERAIVADEPGTTRDTVEEKLVLGGVLLRVADTAGLRTPDGEIERQGISRSLAAAGEAGIVIAVFDGSAPLSDDDFTVIETAKKAPLAVALLNKSDLAAAPGTAVVAPGTSVVRAEFEHCIEVSAKTGAGFGELDRRLTEIFSAFKPPPGEAVITNTRQFEAVERAYSAVSHALEAYKGGFTPDAVLLDVEDAMTAIGELNGRSIRDDITGRIFERFCVGK